MKKPENQTGLNVGFARPAIAAAVLTVAIFLTGTVVLKFQHVDDSFITYRCAQNLADGNGLVYNPGERVESTSNFLYAVLIAAWLKTGAGFRQLGDLLINYLSLFFILFELARQARKKSEKKIGGLARYAGFAFVATSLSIIYFAASGMETLFFTALMFAAFVRLAKWDEGIGSVVLTGALLGLAADVRMEAAAFAGISAIFLFMAAQGRRRWIDASALCTGFLAVFLPVLILRWSYYGLPFPNAYYVKVDGGSFDLARRGFSYSLHWLGKTPPAVLALAGAAWLIGKRKNMRRAQSLGAAWILGYLAYATYVGGDFFPLHRFLVPVLPVVGWMLAEQLGALLVEAPRTVSLSLKALVSFAILFAFVAAPRGESGLANCLRQMYLVRHWTRIGMTLSERVPRDAVLFTAPAGAMPYYSGLRAYDSMGLADPVLAHSRRKLGTGLAGHEKIDFGRIFDVRPDLVYLNDFPGGTPIATLFHDFLENQATMNPADYPPDIRETQREIDRQTIYKEMPALLSTKSIRLEYDLMELPGLPFRPVFLVRKTAGEKIRAAFVSLRDS